MAQRGKAKQTREKSKARDFFKHKKLTESQGNLGKAALNTVVDGGTVVVGGLVGAALGRFSLAVGLLTTTAGYYFDNALISRLGLGMAASSVVGAVASLGNTSEPQPQQAGLMGIVDNAVHRVNAWTDDMSKKIWLDKAIAAVKKTDAGVQGLGYAQVYKEQGALAGFGNFDPDTQAKVQKALAVYKAKESEILNKQEPASTEQLQGLPLM